ncbi:BaiN/RdsA family NAD(P)/FAD-dependent oxidoreductase [Edaphobacter albus]|uniref:NAD(P)/FAD-dependent oxidoreductase n=1 Tax=Edaphobacter sp. 4G125 TaxID=2763071 RepID=UPI0016469089|nr:NAD(P)/FAD-dependent oxidoreductase [Edaphobacter sp. 4G125]QNI37129.1 NAD(P)/FAD-dependent oxidoreductase [Edaphobacter sp. 4G125]
METVDVLVIGAGAAGLMCAIEAGRRGRRSFVLDHADRIGKKILISGGGRCNFTNLHCRAESFLSANPHFAKSALARFTPADMIQLVEKHNIRYHEKTLGQLFCDQSAQQIVNMLERECRDANVRILTSAKINRLTKTTETTGYRFTLETSFGNISTKSVVIATGGLSIPKMGATDFGYRIAEQFGIRVASCRPALVPLVFNPEDHHRWCDLSGVSTEVITSAVGIKRPVRFREKMLITHRGLSGPAILQASSYWQPGQPIEINLAPEARVIAPLIAQSAKRDSTSALTALRSVWPARFAERWLATHPPKGWTNPALEHFENELHTWHITPAETEGYAKAEVTAGGVDTAELDAKTMESRKIPGLYFIGEVVDVTGWLGGYNFQWAWASGASAGRAV